MKKVIASVICLVLLSVTTGCAQFFFRTNSDNTITVTGYSQRIGPPLTIPASNNGLPVTSIETNSFQNHVFPSITIPGSITNIGDGAFAGCSFDSVTIGNGVLSIGTNAFSSCSSFSSITIPNSVTNIGDGAFSGDFLLSTVTLGNGIISIGNNAFNDQFFSNITLPPGLVTLGDGAFGNSGVSSVTIPASTTNILGNPFSLGHLNAYAVDVNNPAYVSIDGVLFNKNQTALVAYPSQAAAGTYLIPGGVTTIGVNAFNGTSALTNITIPNSVTSIGSNAFANCTALASADISAAATNLGAGLFADCLALTDIKVDSNNPAFISVNGVLFDHSQTVLVQYPAGHNAKSYAIPAGVTNIADEAFYYALRLTNITIPDGVFRIGNSAFITVTAPSLVIPASVTKLEDYAFGGGSLRRVYFKGNPPVAASTIFSNAIFATATSYYLPGSTGWSNVFAGRPALLWNPSLQTVGGSTAFQNGQFGFNVTGTPNIPILIQASPSLGNPAWTSLTNTSLTNGSFSFNDPQAASFPRRFYRVVGP